MRWSWQKQRETAEYRLAICCFVGAERTIATLAGENGPDLTGGAYWTALTEVVCCALHLADRALHETVPELRSVRMDALVVDCLKLMP
jgi:hypothetical protein